MSDTGGGGSAEAPDTAGEYVRYRPQPQRADLSRRVRGDVKLYM